MPPPASLSCALDVLKLAPTLAWLITSIRAIPAYSNLGWTTPVVCAVFSSILAVVATRDIYLYHTPHLHGLYTPIAVEENNEGSPSSSPQKADENFPTEQLAKVKLAIASSFVLLSFVFTVVFMAIAYGTIKPEQDNMPCNGECEGCIDDPDCSLWVEKMEGKYSSVNICPPAKKSADTDVTFSCLADGYWMLTTTLISCIWLWAAVGLYKRTKNFVNGSGEGSGGGVMNEIDQTL